MLEKGIGFYEPLKKLKIQTFKDTCKQTLAKGTDGTNKEITLKADNRLYSQMLLIAQDRKLGMMEVLSYPFGPKPQVLANGDGFTKKTDKSSHGRHTEKETANTDSITDSRATFVHAMEIVQIINGEKTIFEELSQQVQRQVLHNGERSGRIHVVIDLYEERSG